MKLTLPWPPSANAIWRSRGKRVYRAGKYIAWLKECEGLWLAQKPVGFTPLDFFEVKLKLTPPDRRRRDLDNRIKATMDALQHIGAIQDDARCRSLHVQWQDKDLSEPRAEIVLTSCSSNY